MHVRHMNSTCNLKWLFLQIMGTLGITSSVCQVCHIQSRATSNFLVEIYANMICLTMRANMSKSHGGPSSSVVEGLCVVSDSVHLVRLVYSHSTSPSDLRTLLSHSRFPYSASRNAECVFQPPPISRAWIEPVD